MTSTPVDPHTVASRARDAGCDDGRGGAAGVLDGVTGVLDGVVETGPGVASITA